MEEINQTDFDIQNLKDDCLKQSSRYMYYGDLAAKARSARDKADLRLTQLEADTDLRIREEASKASAKVTEGLIKSKVTTDPAIQQAHAQLLQAESDLALLDTAMKALDHKKSMLESLVKLEVSGVYNGRDADADIANAIRLKLNAKR